METLTIAIIVIVVVVVVAVVVACWGRMRPSPRCLNSVPKSPSRSSSVDAVRARVARFYAASTSPLAAYRRTPHRNVRPALQRFGPRISRTRTRSHGHTCTVEPADELGSRNHAGRETKLGFGLLSQILDSRF